MTSEPLSIYNMGMPCAWQPSSNHEIEQTRLHRRVQRLERRLTYLRRGRCELFVDDIAALEDELAHLKDQAGDRGYPYRLLFGRFLNFCTTGSNSEKVPKNLSERMQHAAALDTVWCAWRAICNSFDS